MFFRFHLDQIITVENRSVRDIGIVRDRRFSITDSTQRRMSGRGNRPSLFGQTPDLTCSRQTEGLTQVDTGALVFPQTSPAAILSLKETKAMT